MLCLTSCTRTTKKYIGGVHWHDKRSIKWCIVATPVSWPYHLHQNQQKVNQMTNKEEAKCT